MAASGATLLAAAWRDWAGRLAELDGEAWSRPTRCEGWTVHDLVAHAAPDPAMVGGLEAPVLPPPATAAVDDAATLLRRFNEPGGVAHEMADAVAAQAHAAAEARPAAQLVDDFRACADLVERMALAPTAVVPHPVVGSVTMGVLTDVSLMEAAVHLLDLVVAVGGPPPDDALLAHAAELLVRVVGPARFLDAATGRARCDTVLPAVR